MTKEDKALMMVEQLECLWTLISILVHFIHVLRKALSMALCSSASAPPPSPLSWKRVAESPDFVSKKTKDSSEEVAVERFVGQDCSMAAGGCLAGDAGKARKLRSRPARLVIPRCSTEGSVLEAYCRKEEDAGRDVEAEGNGYWVVSRRGARHMMEDGYGVMTNIHGDAKQALFGVYDGHGGRAAVDFVSEKLGKNIISAIEELKEEEEGRLESAIKAGYLTTDRDFLSQGVGSGACAATVLLKNGELFVSNAGDCRVVMSRTGVPDVLTSDHRPGREDERIRIENLGGYLSCRNGVWRVQDSLAISRAIGDVNMKKWIISEPETRSFQLNQDCEFLILASDGLWDKVSNQEAVDVVMRHKNSLQSCKELVEISCNRGNRDDITIMVVNLSIFCTV